ncbi:uncharacterized protein LOC109863261 isoform X2 [Pseudomyrmex gracilis]|uniref:uncharacterized protein LOC109863261 isoform X2 n=1 Tax=Pseudomyrmex gracilis TaxID=219809 RepID=UPI000994EE14|nr:uncharacterized protein LOC109863261 isoform X2 [Pseudomyrmex gracilis]
MTAVMRRESTCSRLHNGFLLVNFFVLSVQGAPMTLEEKRLNTPPKWVNPCGLASEDFDGDLDVVQFPDEQLIQQIVLQASQALYHAERFRDRYLEYTFGSDLSSLHSPQFNLHYGWLPGQKEIPKQLGENLDQDYLKKIELDEILLNVYENMQKFAVGLEQIVWDQEDYGLSFRNEFKEAEFKLRGVLCELQVALVERGLTPRPDITRDIMTSEFRKKESRTQTELRDWLIFRDYMNGLEYVVQVFEHLGQRLRAEQS